MPGCARIAVASTTMSASISTGSPLSVSMPSTLMTSPSRYIFDTRPAQVLGLVFLDGPARELVVALPGRADVHVEHDRFPTMNLVVVEHRVLRHVHAQQIFEQYSIPLEGSREPMHCRNTTVRGSLPSEGRRILPPVGPEAEARRSN